MGGGRDHHHRSDEDSDPNQYPPPGSNPYGYQPPPPPSGPFYGRPEFPPPPTNVLHVSHEYGGPAYPPQPPPVQHVSHEVGGYRFGYENPEHRPHHHELHHNRPGFFPSEPPLVAHVSHENRLDKLVGQPTVRVYTKAREDFSLSIREGRVVLVTSDPSDPCQHWIKDQRYSTRVKDEVGYPSFALVNKATGEAIKHSIGATHPVRLVPYNPDFLDESVLWTESHDIGEGFRCIRMVNNIRLNFDAFHGDAKSGGVHDGTIVVLWEWLEGINQRWKIVPY